MIHRERNMQMIIAKMLDVLGVLYCASAGGMRTNIRTAVNMKRMGYKAGFPDIFIYEPRKGYHGMAIELKSGSYPTEQQKGWVRALNERGYYALIVPANLDFNSAVLFIENHVNNYLCKE